jgi:hypothetical protein
VGTAYNQAISTKGGAEPIIFDVVAGAAPGGLTLNAATGVLSGAPTARGIYNFVIRATDNNGCVGWRQCQIIVN